MCTDINTHAHTRTQSSLSLPLSCQWRLDQLLNQMLPWDLINQILPAAFISSLPLNAAKICLKTLKGRMIYSTIICNNLNSMIVIVQRQYVKYCNYLNIYFHNRDIFTTFVHFCTVSFQKHLIWNRDHVLLEASKTAEFHSCSIH